MSLRKDESGVGLELALITVSLLIIGVMISYWLYNTWQSLPKAVLVIEGEPVVSGDSLYVTVKNVGTDDVIVYKVLVDDVELPFTLEAIEGDVSGNSIGPGASGLIKASGVSGDVGDLVKFLIITSRGTIRGSAVIT